MGPGHGWAPVGPQDGWALAGMGTREPSDWMGPGQGWTFAMDRPGAYMGYHGHSREKGLGQGCALDMNRPLACMGPWALEIDGPMGRDGSSQR